MYQDKSYPKHNCELRALYAPYHLGQTHSPWKFFHLQKATFSHRAFPPHSTIVKYNTYVFHYPRMGYVSLNLFGYFEIFVVVC